METAHTISELKDSLLSSLLNWCPFLFLLFANCFYMVLQLGQDALQIFPVCQQPQKTADLLKDKHLRKNCQSDASLRGMLSRITGECLLLPVATRGEGVGMEGGEYAIGHLMDAVRCHSTALHRLLGSSALQTLAKAEGNLEVIFQICCLLSTFWGSRACILGSY